MSNEEPKDFEQVVKQEKKPVEIDTTRLINNTPAFIKLRNDINESQIAEIRRLAPLRSYDIEIDGQVKTFDKRKIKVREYAALERKRGRLAKEKDQEKAAELLIEIYQDCARDYLGMTPEEYENADMETVRKILDTCNIVTTQGIPNS